MDTRLIFGNGVTSIQGNAGVFFAKATHLTFRRPGEFLKSDLSETRRRPTDLTEINNVCYWE